MHWKMGAVVALAITISRVDWGVLEGVRTMRRQKRMKATGKSKTLNSKHLRRGKSQGFPVGHAVDLGVIRDGKLSTDPVDLRAVANSMLEAARRLNIKVKSGGVSWDWDWYHFELADPKDYL